MTGKEIATTREAEVACDTHASERDFRRRLLFWLSEIALQLARNNEIMADCVEAAKELNV